MTPAPVSRSLLLACVVGVLFLSGGWTVEAAGFRCNACQVKASEVARCWNMDRDDHSTGLLFNPPGMKTLFKRSSCLQGAAVRYRDDSLCEDVRERRSPFFDGSAISRERCRQAVLEARHGDPPVVVRDLYRLADVAYFRNGNGRDVDIHIGSSGSYRHEYELGVSMLGEAGAGIETLHRRDYHFGASTGQLRIRIQEEKIAAAAATLSLQPPYRIRVTLALVEPTLWEVEQFISLPREERESAVEHLVDPAALERDPEDLRR